MPQKANHASSALRIFCQEQRIKDTAPNAPRNKGVEKRRSDSAENEPHRHAFNVQNTACYKAFTKRKQGYQYSNTLSPENAGIKA